MELNGFVQLRRGIVKHLPDLPDLSLKVFIYILCAAKFKEPDIGTLDCGLKDIADALRIDKSRVSRAISHLIPYYIIFEKGVNKTRVSRFTVVKYATAMQQRCNSDATVNGVFKPNNNKLQAPYNDKEGLIRINNTSFEQKHSKGRKNVFPVTDYKKVTDAYMRIKKVEPVGNEWLPIQQAIKIMFKASRTPEQIIDCMEWLEHESGYSEWTINTVRVKMPDFVAGKLTKEDRYAF